MCFTAPNLSVHMAYYLQLPQGSSIFPRIPLFHSPREIDECLLLCTFLPGLGLYLGCPHTSISHLTHTLSPPAEGGAFSEFGAGKGSGDALLLTVLPS